jgi:hypothetical protein
MPPAQPDGHGLWRWLLRSTGLEAWFQQAPAAAHVGQVERVFLQVSLPSSKAASSVFAEALADCLPTIQASGGEVVNQQAASALLSWPVVLGSQQAQVIRAYFQLRESMSRLLGQPALRMCGAASLGWVMPNQAKAGQRYRGEVLSSVAGILRAAQPGNALFVSAALHHRLDLIPAFNYELDVAFDVAGHRYPATLFRVSAA